MIYDRISATRVIGPRRRSISAVVADPEEEATIEGAGCAGESHGCMPLTAVHIFRMPMYRPGYPAGRDEMAGRVQASDPPDRVAGPVMA